MRKLLPIFAICFGCSEYSADERTSDTAFALPDAGHAEFLRLDIHASAVGNGNLLDQSFLLEEGLSENISLSLAAPVTLRGSVQGRSATPQPQDGGVPGSEGPIDAVIRAHVPDTIMSYAVATDEEGRFETAIIPAAGYTLAVLPSTDTGLPFLVDLGATFQGKTELDVSLGWDASVPVYGRIIDFAGEPLPDVPVRLIDSDSGVAGPIVETDATGVYNLRAYSGEYLLEVMGDPHRALPRLEQSVAVNAEALEGLLVSEVQYHHMDLATVSGGIIDSNGEPAAQVLVRLRSLEVFGFESTEVAEVLTESTTGSNGRFSIRVAPGRYSVELIPPHEGDMSPMFLEDEVTFEGGFSELPSVTLSPRPQVAGRLLNSSGSPLEGALVRARELSFNEGTFETYTDDDGTFSLDVSDDHLEWTLIPADSSDGAITTQTGWPQDVDGSSFQLAYGVPLAGCVGGQGDALPFVLVEARGRDGHLYGSTLTDQDGCFRIRVDWQEDFDLDDTGR